MATVKLVTNVLVSYNDPLFSCLIFSNGPSKTIEAKSVDEIAAALDTFATELKDTGKPWMAMAIVAKGFRKPPGFDKAAHKLRRFVNTELVQKAA